MPVAGLEAAAGVTATRTGAGEAPLLEPVGVQFEQRNEGDGNAEAGERAAAETAWVRRFFDALRPHRADGVYVNFLDSDDDSRRVLEAYGERNYRRLAGIKAKYDPDNVFHHNKNIRPG